VAAALRVSPSVIRFENGHGAVALFDGNAELNALYQAFEALGVVALVSTDHAFGHDMAAIGQGQHDAAIETLNAQVDLIIRCKSIGNELERVVHDASPPD
jgi:3-oxoacyl-(acyl-carrier-protein) synthase